MNFIIGHLEDNVLLLTYNYLLRTFGESSLKWIAYPFGMEDAFSNTSQPIMWYVFSKLSVIFNELLIYNATIIFGIVLTFFVTYKLFNYLVNKKLAAALGAFLFVFSPFFYYQSRSHIDLVQYYCVVMFIYLLIRSINVKDYFLSGIVLGGTILISNYFGFICLLFLVFHFLLRGIVSKAYDAIYWTKKCIFGHLLTLFIALSVAVPFLLPYLKAQFFNKSNLMTESEYSVRIPQRSLEDFVSFSAKPWYYLLPSVDNPFFGDFTGKTLNVLQDKWGYFWLQNYFKSEHSASYLGIINIALTSVFIYSFIKKTFHNAGRKDELSFYSHRILIATLLLTGVCFMILSLPPIFTFNSKTYYLPSYFIWKYFPMFRVLSRLSTVVFLIVCLCVSFVYKTLINKKQYFYVCVFFLVSLMELYIPIKVVYTKNAPQIYTYIQNELPNEAVLAVYPHSELTSALFWMRTYNRPLANIRGFVDAESHFDSSTFTDSLTTCSGLYYAREFGVTHIVYWGLPPVPSGALVSFNSVAPTDKFDKFSDFVVISKGVSDKDAHVFELVTLLAELDCVAAYE